MSVHTDTVADTTFPRRRAAHSGWSDDISMQSYKKLVAFLKAQVMIAPMRKTGKLLYHVNRDRPQTCWDHDRVEEHMREQDSLERGWWFHVDDDIDDEQEPNTFQVKDNMSLNLLDLRFLGPHENLWARIVEIVNQEPNLFAHNVMDTSEGVRRMKEIKRLTDEIAQNITGSDALCYELENMGIVTTSNHHRWFWRAMREVKADGYVSYDHNEARSVKTLSPSLLKRPFLPPIVDKFGHIDDATTLASGDESTKISSLSVPFIVRSNITFPQVVLSAQGAQKLDWINPLPESKRECDWYRAQNRERHNESREEGSGDTQGGAEESGEPGGDEDGGKKNTCVIS